MTSSLPKQSSHVFHPGPWSGLVWPRLFQTLSLALRPGRVLLGFVLILALWAAAALPSMWLPDRPTPAHRAAELGAPVVERLPEAITRLDLLSASEALRYLVLDLPAIVVVEQPASAAASVALGLVVWAFFGGAIARSAATEFAIRHRLSSRSSVAFSFSKVRSTSATLALPILTVGLLAGLLHIIGLSASASPIVGGAVAVGFVLVLVLALVAVLLVLGYVLGFPLLVAAVVCEGTDAIDALQRTFAYVLGRPVRLVLYSAVFYAQLLLLAIVCSALAAATVSFAMRWVLSPETSGHVAHVPSSARVFQAAWMALFFALAGGVVLSFFHTGSAVLYLLLRQANDGQDPADLWQPGHAKSARERLARAHADSDASSEADDADA